MITSTHLFIGAAIGKATGNLFLTIPLAFVSHFLLDAIPHYNPKQVKSYLEKGLRGVDIKDLLLKSIEPLIGISIVGYAIYVQSELALIMSLGALFGWLPDLLVFLEWKFNNNSGIIKKIETYYHRHTSFFLGIVPQVIISVLALLYLF